MAALKQVKLLWRVVGTWKKMGVTQEDFLWREEKGHFWQAASGGLVCERGIENVASGVIRKVGDFGSFFSCHVGVLIVFPQTIMLLHFYRLFFFF